MPEDSVATASMPGMQSRFVLLRWNSWCRFFDRLGFTEWVPEIPFVVLWVPVR